MEYTDQGDITSLEFVAVRLEKGVDVAVLIDTIAGIYYGDKGDILDAFVGKKLYVIRAKQSSKSIKMKRNPAFCRLDGTGCSPLTLPLVYIEDERERTWHASNDLKTLYPLLFKTLQEQFNIEE